jgi:hypothetical protein
MFTARRLSHKNYRSKNKLSSNKKGLKKSEEVNCKDNTIAHLLFFYLLRVLSTFVTQQVHQENYTC